MSYKNDALANLVSLASTLPEPYLVTGSQAAYIYHRWLRPIPKMITLCIPEERQAPWRAILRPPWTVLDNSPGLNQVRLATRMVILEPHLTEKRYERRVVYQGLAFTSAEDICIDLLCNSKTQIGLSEVAALLIKQKDTLDWTYLFSETSSSWLGHRLTEIIQMINHQAGRLLLKTQGFQAQVPPPPPDVTSIHSDSLAAILRPLRAQWEIADVQSA